METDRRPILWRKPRLSQVLCSRSDRWGVEPACDKLPPGLMSFSQTYVLLRT